MTCMAPQFCDWVSNGITGRINGVEPEGPSGVPAAGTPCVFPFHYNGQVYTQCQQPSQLPGFLDNLRQTELTALNTSTITICALTSNLTENRSWAVCSCKNLSAMQTSFSYTFNIFFLRSSPPAVASFIFYYEMILSYIFPQSGPTLGGTRYGCSFTASAHRLIFLSCS
jgi:hypothetical protein